MAGDGGGRCLTTTNREDNHADVQKHPLARRRSKKIWHMIGDFGKLGRWHPAIASSEIESGGGATVRRLTTGDGAVLRERLLARSDSERSYSYSIVESPLPVRDYHSTIRVADLGGGRSAVIWQGRFEAVGEAEAALDLIAGIYDAGLDNLRKMVEG